MERNKEFFGYHLILGLCLSTQRRAGGHILWVIHWLGLSSSYNLTSKDPNYHFHSQIRQVCAVKGDFFELDLEPPHQRISHHKVRRIFLARGPKSWLKIIRWSTVSRCHTYENIRASCKVKLFPSVTITQKSHTSWYRWMWVSIYRNTDCNWW